VSPTVFRWKEYRFFFFSREEKRIHIHVYCPDGEAKFWIEPHVLLARNYNLSESRIGDLKKKILEHRDEITVDWKAHFRS